jgi:hypothetical protein
MNNTMRVLQYILMLAVGIGNAQAVSAQEEESKKHAEIKYKMTFTTTRPDRKICSASLEFEYQQKNTVAAVDSTLDTLDCGAASGGYTVLVRFRDANNELQSLEYPVTWQRDDDKVITASAEYVIGEDVDLVTVRPRKLRCLCAPSEEDVTDTEE